MAMMKTDAYRKFKDCILTGQLRPGQFVTQKELCELIGVPIAPAREAIQRLEHETLLTVYPKRGIQISDVSPRLIRNAYQMRIMIELSGMKLYIQDANIEDVNTLLKRSQDMLKTHENKELSSDDLKELDDLDEHFHNVIVEHLDNELLMQVYQINQARIRLIRMSNRQTGERKIPAMREHVEILTACSDRDATKAGMLLEQHLQLSMRRAMDGC